jgi:hypothetical protein
MSSTTLNSLWFGDRLPDRRATGEIIVRVLLAALALALCYSFDWTWLRALTMQLNLRLDALLGVVLQPISNEAVMWHGAVYRYGIACTFADVWCAAIPLIWDFRPGWKSNLRVLAAFTVALFAFNIVRLSISDVLFAAGLSWNVAHNMVAGVAYFAIWEFVRRRLKRIVRSQPQAQLSHSIP